MRKSSRSYEATEGHATRVPVGKHRGTSRGWTIFNDIVVYHESELEHRVSLRLQARNDVASLHSQYPVFHFADIEGRRTTHTGDYYVVYRDGLRQSVVVKHEKEREETELMIAQILLDPSSHQVNEIVLRTEAYGNIEALENADMVLWSREYHHQPDVDELLEVLRHTAAWIRFGTLLQDARYEDRRRVAIWRLLDAGILFSPTGETINELSWLGYAPAGGPTGLLG